MSVKNSRMRIWLTFGTAAAILVIGVVAGAQNLTVKGTITGEQNTYFATAGGNVGVGTVAPAYKLDVYSGAAGYQARVASPDGYLTFGPANAGWSHFSTDRPSFWFNTTVTVQGNINTYNGGVSLSGAGVSYLNGGNVGIGTSSPASRLTVVDEARIEGTSPQLRFEDTDGSTYWFHSNSNTFYLLWDAGLNGGWVAPYPVYFSGRSATFNAGTLAVDAGTNRVGVGVTSPSYTLHVAGNTLVDGGWLRVSGSQGLYFESYGGGWHMQDSTWIRSYNSKPVYMSAGFDTANPSGVACGGGLGGGYNFRVCGTQQVTSDLTVSGNLHASNSLYLYGYLRGNNYGFGGMYKYNTYSGCVHANPYTGACSCPGGNWAQAIDQVTGSDKYTGNYTVTIYWCVR